MEIPGTTDSPPVGPVVDSGDVEGRAYQVFQDGKVAYQAINGAVLVFKDEKAFRDYAGNAKAGSPARTRVKIGFGIILLALVTLPFTIGAGFVWTGLFIVGFGLIVSGLF